MSLRAVYMYCVAYICAAVLWFLKYVALVVEKGDRLEHKAQQTKMK